MSDTRREYADLVLRNHHYLQFHYEGQLVKDNDTPMSLRMKDRDIIEVYGTVPREIHSAFVIILLIYSTYTVTMLRK